MNFNVLRLDVELLHRSASDTIRVVIEIVFAKNYLFFDDHNYFTFMFHGHLGDGRELGSYQKDSILKKKGVKSFNRQKQIQPWDEKFEV